jgi:hypothetical protein
MERSFDPAAGEVDVFPQTRWRRHRPWPVHHSRHHRQATFGVHRGRFAAR